MDHFLPGSDQRENKNPVNPINKLKDKKQIKQMIMKKGEVKVKTMRKASILAAIIFLGMIIGCASQSSNVKKDETVEPPPILLSRGWGNELCCWDLFTHLLLMNLYT